MITLEKHLAAHASVNPGEEDAHLILCHCGTWFDDEGDHRAHVAATWREAQKHVIDRAKSMIGTIDYARSVRVSPAYPDDTYRRMVADLLAALTTPHSPAHGSAHHRQDPPA
ncbi:hypothetical protein [Gordonia sp. SND2]|uniref:hypothetical protein n=1 Tax=Gordonia sp. SND2 TaxID=3388659 RepID=UPI00398B3AFC